MSAEKPVFKLKDIYSPQLLQTLARQVQQAWPAFPAEHFLTRFFDPQWEALELKERMRHISSSLREDLPESYPLALEVLLEVTRRLIRDQGEKMTFEYGFLPDFVERFGLEQPDLSIPALEQMTRWTSAEFAVRPYLLRYPDQMYEQMLSWADHTSDYVRRLASEGFRPRLPWGMGIPVLKKRPELVLPVLEKLKNDPAETVRRSVANNLNDISKDHPERVLEIAGQWLGDNAETDWIIRHACRGLLKKAHPEALRLFGFQPGQSVVKVSQWRHDAEVKIGERFYFDFSLENTGSTTVLTRLEYAIDYQTLSGKISRKVFKVSEFELAASEQRSFTKNQRFQDFTTRKHFPGAHRIAILVNGGELAAGNFLVNH